MCPTIPQAAIPAAIWGGHHWTGRTRVVGAQVPTNPRLERHPDSAVPIGLLFTHQLGAMPTQIFCAVETLGASPQIGYARNMSALCQ